ncbi:hypothetical protein GCM10009665_26010 [Kitasatospora nipponensis]|uniref:Uncharacterized protein n=1 Tax=Kitasatospora nipponensis TaxID=258049 RepID=A0ABN1W795_9ACTN
MSKSVRTAIVALLLFGPAFTAGSVVSTAFATGAGSNQPTASAVAAAGSGDTPTPGPADGIGWD